MNGIWKQIIEVAIGSVFTFLIDLVASAIKKVASRRKKKRTNDDLINYFRNTITSEKGSLNHILYNKQRLILAQKYHTNIQVFLPYDELEQYLLSEAEKAPFIDFNSLQKIKERILNFIHDQSGSMTVEGAVYVFLIMIAGLVLCEAVKQIQTNTFVVSIGKIIGFLLAVSVLTYYHWCKRKY